MRKQRKKTTHRRHLEHLPWPQPRSFHQHQAQERPHDTHARQDWPQQVRQTGRRGRVCGGSEGLHTSTAKTHEHEDSRNQPQHTMTPFAMQELDIAINRIKGGKAADTTCQRSGDQALHQKCKNTCYDHTPKSPSQARNHHELAGHDDEKAIYKSGDGSSPSNHGPVWSISTFYTLFSQLLYKRLKKTMLDAIQSVDQAGFRTAHSTADHLYTFQKLRQRQQPLGVAATGFNKAVDTVKHSSVWRTLREQGIEEPYTQMLTKLHDKQRATVRTDVKKASTPTPSRGTKLGDPVSTRTTHCRRIFIDFRSSPLETNKEASNP